MTSDQQQDTRGRRNSARRRRKTTAGKTAEVSNTQDASGTDANAGTASQVDVAEVARATTLTVEGSSAEDAKKSTPRRNVRGGASSRKRSRGGRGKPRSDGKTDEPPPSESQPTPDRTAEREQNAPRVATRPQDDKAHKEPVAAEPADSRGEPETRAATRPAGRSSDRPRRTPAATAGRAMLINVSGADECRIAVLHEGRLEELFIERASSVSHVGNIYKGRITNIEPSIQAAFVDFGLPQNGFLHVSDLQPQYFPDHKGVAEQVGRKMPRHTRPLMQNCLRRGQDVVVQVTREGVGTKGPTLSTYLSIPGRFLVMMPGMNRHGVSRKIEDEAERRSMRELLKELDLPSGIGFILRTAGLGRTKRELQRDLSYLTRLWKTVVDRIKSLPSPAELYQESDLVTRTIRDVYTADFKRLIVDDAETAKKAREFLQLAMPRTKAVVELYSDLKPLFHKFGIEKEIERINMRHVPLASGGSIVIDTTEAMVTIDVNSGRSRTTDDADEMAYKINVEAAEEIARQLRLRDLGGLIVCDFIDMRSDSHKRDVERALRNALKEHKERAKILRMSAFGLIEMTRQRQGPSLKRNIYYDCPHCMGSGVVKMPDSVVLDVMRTIQLAAHHVQVQKVTVTVATGTAFQILNTRRSVLNEIETETGKEIIVRGDPGFTSDQVECLCEDSRGRPVYAVPVQATRSRV